MEFGNEMRPFVTENGLAGTKMGIAAAAAFVCV